MAYTGGPDELGSPTQNVMKVILNFDTMLRAT
jgi:hypothetical protein